MKLDKNRPYGVCSGGQDGACFEQDGKSFDMNGDLIGAEPAPEKGKPGRKPKAAEGDQLSKQLGG